MRKSSVQEAHNGSFSEAAKLEPAAPAKTLMSQEVNSHALFLHFKAFLSHPFYALIAFLLHMMHSYKLLLHLTTLFVHLAHTLVHPHRSVPRERWVWTTTGSTSKRAGSGSSWWWCSACSSWLRYDAMPMLRIRERRRERD